MELVDETEEEASLRQERAERGEQVDDETEDGQEGVASLRQRRVEGVEKDEGVDDEQEEESCSPECSGRTGRRLAHFEGDAVALLLRLRTARFLLSGDKKL